MMAHGFCQRHVAYDGSWLLLEAHVAYDGLGLFLKKAVQPMMVVGLLNAVEPMMAQSIQ